MVELPHDTGVTIPTRFDAHAEAPEPTAVEPVLPINVAQASVSTSIQYMEHHFDIGPSAATGEGDLELVARGEGCLLRSSSFSQ